MSNSISISMVYSPPLAFFIYELFGFSASFIYAGAVAFVGSAVAMGLSEKRVRIPERQDAGDDKVPLINKRALFPMTVFLTYTFTTAPVYLFMPGIAEDRGFGNPGLYFTFNSLTSILMLLVSGRLSDRFGRGAMIVPGLLTVAAGMFLLATAEMRWLFWLSGSLSGLGFGMIQPSMQSWDGGAGAAARAQLGYGDATAGLGHRRLVHRRVYDGRDWGGHGRGGYVRHSGVWHGIGRAGGVRGGASETGTVRTTWARGLDCQQTFQRRLRRRVGSHSHGAELV